MNWRDIPNGIWLNGTWWPVVWRDKSDASWVGERCHGRTCLNAGENRIELCTSLKHQPWRLGEVWLHEVAHAGLHSYFHAGYKNDPNRPKNFKYSVEETVVRIIGKVMAESMNQTGWKGTL